MREGDILYLDDLKEDDEKMLVDKYSIEIERIIK